MSVKPPHSPFPSGGNNNTSSYGRCASGGYGSSGSTSPCTNNDFEFPNSNLTHQTEGEDGLSYFSGGSSTGSDTVRTSSNSASSKSTIKKRPAKLDLSQNAPVRSGLQTPNSAKNSKSFSSVTTSNPRVTGDNSSAISTHLRFRSPSMPINALKIGGVGAGPGPELPEHVEPIAPQVLANMLMTSNYSNSNLPTTETSNATGLDAKNTGMLVPPSAIANHNVGLPSPVSSNSDNSLDMADVVRSDSWDPVSPTSLYSTVSNNFQENVLLVDVRPYAQYALGHIRHATSVCIPSTLLKRPNFGIDKFINCMIPDQRQRLTNIDKYQEIILYDQSTLSFPNANGTSLLYSLLKFSKSPDVIGKISYLGGGYSNFETQHPFLVEKAPTRANSSMSSLEELSSSADFNESAGTSQSSLILSLPPVLTGFSLPETSTKDGPLAAFANQIPSTLHNEHDTMPVALPDGLTTAKDRLPGWLKDIAGPDGPGIIAERFQDIEVTEKIRLQGALSKEQAFGEMPPRSAGFRYSISAGMELGTKNRYHNIFPYDHTRVVLKSTEGEDYINASYISSVLSNKKYIATQGPLPDTFKDFWRMIWDQEIPVILMLTAESEGGMVKCHTYWGSNRIGKINVVQTQEKSEPLSGAADSNSIVVRKFELYHDDHPSKIKKVVQIQYTDWPDLGTPASPDDLISLCRVKEKYLNESRIVSRKEPIALVHCSAGCGRTGTFCSVDTVIDILSNLNKDFFEEDIVFNVVHEFRSQRLSMVQSLRQYILCYESILLWCIQNMTSK
jgi:tyrosine-protein phosphatase 2/3